MSSTTLTETLSSTPTTYGKLRYVAADHTPTPSPELFELPAKSEFGDERLMPLHDLRPLPTVDQLPTAKEGTAQLLTHGFTAVKHPSIMHSAPYTHESWRDPGVLKQTYVPETVELMKRITGARTILILSLVLRDDIKGRQTVPPANNDHNQSNPTDEARAEAAEKDQNPTAPHSQGTSSMCPSLPLTEGFSVTTGGLPPSHTVHCDFAPAGARSHIRFFHPTLTAACAPIIAAEDRLLAANLPLATHYSTTPSCPRWAVYSFWRPLKRVRRDPLACGDMRSFAEEDLVTVDVMAPTFAAEESGEMTTHISKTWVGKGREGHRWCYVSEQMPDEVMILSLWDSARESGALHGSVELEGREGEESRVSLETRCFAIW